MRRPILWAARGRACIGHSRGRTLIELLIVCSIVSALFAGAIPSMHRFAERNRLAAASNQFLYALALARSEAVKRELRVVLCPGIADPTAPPHCIPRAGWEIGWLVFADRNNDGTVDDNEPLILAGTLAERGAVTIRGNRYVSHYISFTPFGTARMRSGALQMGTLIVCSGEHFGPTARAIIISAAGRVRTTSASRSGKSSCDP